MLEKGNAQALLGKNNDALITYATLLKNYPKSIEARKGLLQTALVNKSMDKEDAAIEAYKKYIEVDPNAKDAADVMFTIAATAQKAGDKATAIEYYKKLSGNAKYAAQATQQLGALQK